MFHAATARHALRRQARGAFSVVVLAVVAACTPRAGNGGACEVDHDCADGLVCFAGICSAAQACPANGRVCDDDRVCAGGFCDKQHDSVDGVTGDGIPATADPFGCCVTLVCQADADCNAGEICDLARGVCLPAATCDPTSPNACTSSAEGAELCRWLGDAPSCESVSDLPAPDACELASAGAVVVEGGHLPRSAIGTKNGAPLAFAPFVFTVDHGALAADGTYTGCVGPDPCTVQVTATSPDPLPGAASCSGTETVLPAHAAGTTRVVVVDRATRAPLADVAVQALFGGALVSTKTDAHGIATFFADADVVSVLPRDHDWHTVVAPAALGGDVIVVTRATPDPASVAGKKGTLDVGSLHSVGDITFGMAGLALPSLVDVDLASVMGASTPTPVIIQGITRPNTIVTFPSGETAALGTDAFKTGFVALAPSTTGHTLAWGVAQAVHLADVATLIDEVFGPTAPRPALNMLFDTAETLFAADHAVLAIDVDTGPAPPPDADLLDPSAWPFTSIDLATTTQAALERELAWPAAAPHPDAAVVAFARVPGRGLVVLGGTAKRDIVAAAAEPNQILVGFAPPHDGLEGAAVTLAAISLEHTALADEPTSIALSAAFVDPGNEVVPPFLPALHARFGAGALTSTNDPGADLYRVQLDGRDGRWFVWSTSTPAFDTTKLTDGTLGSRADRVRLEAIALSTPFAAVVAGDGVDIADIDIVTERITSEPHFQ